MRLGGGKKRVGVAPSIVCWLRVRNSHRKLDGVLWAGAGVSVGADIVSFSLFSLCCCDLPHGGSKALAVFLFNTVSAF